MIMFIAKTTDISTQLNFGDYITESIVIISFSLEFS